MLITIGSFDGFHKGHEKLFKVCREKSLNNDWGVATFSPHPGVFLGKLSHSMFTLKERVFLAKIFDIPKFFVFEFNEELKNLSPEEFINILIKNFNIDGIVVGNDFHFGRERIGSADSLEKICKDKIKIFKLALFDKKKYSSSKAREKLLKGNVESVQEILGYPWFMISDVIHGNARGRTMNFPTANMNLNNRIVPAEGVYCTAALINNKFHCGALSIGSNPTFGDVNETRAEVFITDFHGDIYGSEILIFFLARLRGIKTFESREALMNQIGRDIEACEKFFRKSMQVPATEKFLGRAKSIYRENQKINSEIIDIKSCL